MRNGFLQLAHRAPRRYLVVDAGQPPEAVAAAVRERLEPMLPLTAEQQEQAEREQAEAEERARLLAEKEAAEREAAAEKARAEKAEAQRLAAERRAEERARREQGKQEQAQAKAAEEAARREEQERLAAERERERVAAEQVDVAAHEEALRRRHGTDAQDAATTARIPSVQQRTTRTRRLDDEIFSLSDPDADDPWDPR